jgi:hypothetical protein
MAREGYDLFISYRRESDAAEARVIYHALKSRGMRVFLDVDDIRRGHFDTALFTTIAESPNFLVILSPHALDRCVIEADWLRREITQAIATGRNIIPIIMPGFEFPRELPESIRDLSRRQGIEYSHTLLKTTIDKILDGAVEFHPSPMARLMRPAAGLLLVACLVLLVIGRLYDWQGLRRRTPSITVVPSQPNGQSLIAENLPAAKNDPVTPAPVARRKSGPGAATESKSSTLESSAHRGELASRPADGQTPELQTVTYGIAYEGKVTRIFSKLPYLDAFRSGDVPGLKYRDCPFSFQPAGLLVTAVNNTADDEMLTAVVLKIQSSIADYEPLIVVDSDSPNNLLFTNQGWGDVVDPLVEFTFDEPDDAVALFAPEKQTVRLETFTETVRIPIKKYLPNDLRLRSSVNVSGRIEYGPAGHRRSIRFHTSVRLRIVSGAPAPPDTVYDVEYKTGETGVVTVQLQPRQEIKPGSSAVFLLRMRPDKTGKTRMNIRFLTNEGQILPGGEFQLDLLVPRCHELSFVPGRIGRTQ